MTDPSPSLTEAVTKFVAGRKNAKKGIESNQELGKFVAWCGRDRTVARLSPSEIAEYAQHIGRGGVDAAQKLNPIKSFLTFLKQEGWIETSLAAHLRIPRGRRSAAGSGNASRDSAEGSQLSQEGYDRLVSQLDVLKEERVAVVADIKLAMEDKDFRENAPLDAAKERQGIIEARVRELEASLATGEVDVEDERDDERRQRDREGEPFGAILFAAGEPVERGVRLDALAGQERDQDRSRDGEEEQQREDWEPIPWHF